MYAYLTGKLTYRDPAQAVIETHGVGYLLKISVYTYEQIKLATDACRLYTWLHVKEDGHTLYGFAQPEEKALFMHLISVSGIGPGTALMMLSWTSPLELQNAIVTGDVRSIQAIKGIGPKTAQRVVLELKDKLQKSGWMAAAGLPEVETLVNTTDAGAATTATTPAKATNRQNRDEALAALLALGINRAQAEKNLDTIIGRDGLMLTVEELVKRALRG